MPLLTTASTLILVTACDLAPFYQAVPGSLPVRRHLGCGSGSSIATGCGDPSSPTRSSSSASATSAAAELAWFGGSETCSAPLHAVYLSTGVVAWTLYNSRTALRRKTPWHVVRVIAFALACLHAMVTSLQAHPLSLRRRLGAFGSGVPLAPNLPRLGACGWHQSHLRHCSGCDVVVVAGSQGGARSGSLLRSASTARGGCRPETASGCIHWYWWRTCRTCLRRRRSACAVGAVGPRRGLPCPAHRADARREAMALALVGFPCRGPSPAAAVPRRIDRFLATRLGATVHVRWDRNTGACHMVTTGGRFRPSAVASRAAASRRSDAGRATCLLLCGGLLCWRRLVGSAWAPCSPCAGGVWRSICPLDPHRRVSPQRPSGTLLHADNIP